MSVDREQLLKPRLPEGEVEIEGLGVVLVRGLSRAEVLENLQEVDREVPGAFERRMVSLALVEPRLSEDDVATWQQGSLPFEVERVVEKINELSALSREAAKDAYRGFEADPASEFRLPAGPDAGDDGGAAA
jgi:hypothetical protein